MSDVIRLWEKINNLEKRIDKLEKGSKTKKKDNPKKTKKPKGFMQHMEDAMENLPK